MSAKYDSNEIALLQDAVACLVKALPEAGRTQFSVNLQQLVRQRQEVLEIELHKANQDEAFGFKKTVGSDLRSTPRDANEIISEREGLDIQLQKMLNRCLF